MNKKIGSAINELKEKVKNAKSALAQSNANKKDKADKKNKDDKKTMSKGAKITITVIVSIIALIMLIFLIVGTYIFANVFSFAHGSPAIDLEDYKNNQNQTSFIYAYDDKGKTVEIAKLHGEENRVWVNADQIPDHLKAAFVCLEDKRFMKHNGVDWIRTFGALTMLSDGGGSTITQQLVKNITTSTEVTFVRKYKEIEKALNLENNYDKKSILEAYLNTLYLGSGCYGVQTASEKYFGKDVSELNLAESAVLAVITKAPTTFNPLLNPEDNKERQEHCLKCMLEEGAISKEEYEEAVNYKLVFTNSPEYKGNNENNKKPEDKDDEKVQDFYVDYVIKTVRDDLMKKYGYTTRQAMDKIYYGGLKIYAAVDPNVQKVLNTVYENRIAFPKEKDTPERPAVQSAATVMDYEGRIVGIIGEAGKKSGNLCLNRASESPRQPGSSIKPLSTYAYAIEKDYVNWSSMILDYAIVHHGELWPQNADGTKGSNKPITVQYAIQRSFNTVPARILTEMTGVKESYDYMKKTFHLHNLNDSADCNIAPLATGALTNGTTTVEMAAAYAVFGNNGNYYEPYCYYKVTNSTGTETLLTTDSKPQRVMSEESAQIMRELLKTVKTSSFGTGKNVRRFELMSKTGTTTDEKDSWIAGGTPYYVCAVWLGYDKPKVVPFPYSPAGRVYIELLDRIHKDLPKKEFPKTKKVVEKEYCTKTGLLASKDCKNTAKGYYKLASLPKTCTACSNPVKDTVDEVIEGVSGVVDNIINAIIPPRPNTEDTED